tara:strand:- start:35 stop:193 length:159 start_codon:yes stop_codon:yes gene_type:complete
MAFTVLLNMLSLQNKQMKSKKLDFQLLSKTQVRGLRILKLEQNFELLYSKLD